MRRAPQGAIDAIIVVIAIAIVLGIAGRLLGVIADSSLSRSELCELARAHGGGVPPDLIVALIYEESGGQPAIVSTAGAVGLMQVVSRFHPTIDLTDPAANVRVGSTVLASDYLYLNHVRANITLPKRVDLYDWTAVEWVKRALGGYNMGPGNVVWYDQHPDRVWPEEVSRYAENIIELQNEGLCAAA